jgi:hypothetical protein
MRNFCKLVALAPLAFPALAGAQETASLPYEKLEAVVAQFQAFPVAQRDKVAAIFVAQHADKANHAPIHLWVTVNGARVDFPIAADGVFTLPYHPEWVTANAIVQSDQPKGTMRIGPGIRLVPPPGNTVAFAYFQDGLKQANTVVKQLARRQGGYLAQFLVPTLRSVDVTLPASASATVTTAQGPQTLRPDKASEIHLTAAMLESGAAGTVAFSATPSVFDPNP